MEYFGFEPGTAGWKAQTNPLIFGGSLQKMCFCIYLCRWNWEWGKETKRVRGERGSGSFWDSFDCQKLEEKTLRVFACNSMTKTELWEMRKEEQNLYSNDWWMRWSQMDRWIVPKVRKRKSILCSRDKGNDE